MRRCPHCSAFVPATLCPECDHRLAPPSRALARLRNAALGAGTLLTLAACYGAAYQPMP
ncbi:MAG TPA: hypothetical protein RMH85_16800 [Polyangiaceae bacterium LLY-WYZ-15_(1-7)]|nr:hypothetical protein [Polyangiaceae bacterium LLY-WYZ-15_(1-7)]HJL10162.1 hypothetical protein [Polyangiaceae bacterium LLY-WYZ-15_(1-7)]HJL30447.1 hypothetical protein [Polyangiaceae bacterium LLY-WYZ-15_(1-7)]